MSELDVEQSDNVQTQYSSYLNDESGLYQEGSAEKIVFPTSINEVLETVEYCYNHEIPFTVSGAGTGISGGRVPPEGWIIATDQMREVEDTSQYWKDPETNIKYGVHLQELDTENALLTVPVSMTVKSIQNFCRQHNWFYPPDPTERSAFIGGNVATNASGARSFKFGATRQWIDKLTVVLPEGKKIKLSRDSIKHHITENFVILDLNPLEEQIKIPRPTYELPAVKKNVAGPVITDDSDALDVFIGTGGLFGVVSEVTIRLIRPPKELISIFAFASSQEQALDLIQAARRQRNIGEDPIPLSVEYVGPRASKIMRQNDDRIPTDTEAIIILEQDASSESQLFDYIETWLQIFDDIGIIDTSVAENHQEIEHHKDLRHKVPETVNGIVRGHDQSKLGTDYSVPAENFPELFNFAFEIGEKFESYQQRIEPLGNEFGYAFWAHAGDSHIHLNLLPRSDQETEYAKSLILEVLKKTVYLGGSIAAEHGLGKKKFDGKPALWYQYGEDGLADVERMKRAVDPKFLLNPENLITK